MRKLIGLLLGSVLAFAQLMSVPSALAASATLYLSPASSSVSNGSILTVNVRENSGAEPVNSVQANLSYPADLFDFVSISSSSAWSVVAQNSGGGGSVQIARGALPAVSGDQLVASVRFKAKKDAGTASVNFNGDSAVVSANSNSDIKSAANGGKYTLKPAPPPTPAAPKDTTPPTISGKVEAKEITATTAVVTWTTNEPATSEVSYGPSQSYGIAAADINPVTDHKVTLNSPLITPGTKYHFMVKSVDPSGNAVSSGDEAFMTIGATLEATVVNQSNKPLKGAKVAFGEVSGTTDKNGKVTLKNLPLGKQTGTVTYKNKQAPANIDLKTLEDNGKPHKATFKIDVSSDLWLRILVITLLTALAAMFLYIVYRRGRPSGPGSAGGLGTGPTGQGIKQFLGRLLGRLKGLVRKKKASSDFVSVSYKEPPPPDVVRSGVNKPSQPQVFSPGPDGSQPPPVGPNQPPPDNPIGGP